MLLTHRSEEAWLCSCPPLHDLGWPVLPGPQLLHLQSEGILAGSGEGVNVYPHREIRCHNQHEGMFITSTKKLARSQLL